RPPPRDRRAAVPNPPARGGTSLADSGATAQLPVFLGPHFWRLGWRPGDPPGAEAYLPLPLDVQTAARIVWQDLWRAESGQVVGPVPLRSIDQQIQVSRDDARETVMDLTFGDADDPIDERRWRSITTVLSTTGRDMTRSEYLEFYVAPPPQSDHALIIDIGTVSEDAFYYDSLGATTGTYPDGRPWGLGILDEEARLAENEIWD